MKNLILFVLIVLLGGCSNSYVNYNKEKKLISLKLKDEKNFNIYLENPTFRELGRGPRCGGSSYFINEPNHTQYGRLFIQNQTIKVNNCGWGNISGMVESSLKKVLNLQEIVKVDEETINNYTFKEYDAKGEFGNNMRFFVVLQWSPMERTFIISSTDNLFIDLKGALNKAN